MSGNKQRMGFRIYKDIPRPTPELLERLNKFTVPELCDGMDVFRAMDYQIKPMVTTQKIIGPAVTLQLLLGDSLIVPKALEVAQPGDIIVIDAKGSCNNGVWGDNRSRVAKAIGLAGVVIDGAFRDIEENEALGFPIYARANTCGRSTRGAKGEVNVPISCGGVSVRPGDIIVGGRNGVVVIPLEHAEEIIQAAQEQVDKMEAQIAKFEATGQIVPDSLEAELKRLGY